METHVDIDSARIILHNRIAKGEPDSFNRWFPNGANFADTIILLQLSLTIVPKDTRTIMFRILENTKVKNVTDIDDYTGDVKSLIYWFADAQQEGMEPNDDRIMDMLTSFAMMHDNTEQEV